MARLTRLAVAGLPHLVVQRGHNGQAVFLDADDRQAYLAALREAAAAHGVALHGHALLDSEAWLLLTPGDAPALSRLMQALGRRYVSGFNSRHGRSGTLWDGRFRATVLDPDAACLDALLFIETLLPAADPAAAWSSRAHHLGLAREPSLADPSAYWRLGNTPFDREIAWRGQLEAGLAPSRSAQLAQATRKGWALGSPEFLAALAARVERPLVPRKRGRPPKPAA